MSDNIIILSIETATPVCSVSLHRDGMLLAKSEICIPSSHAAALNESIQFICSSARVELVDVSAVAISEGPGSYTGLRIGASSAKGLCYALDIPLIAVSTLRAMANQLAPVKEELRCPMLDARRMEVYACIYNDDLSVKMQVQPVILDENSFSDYLKSNRVVFFGDGSDKFKDLSTHPNAVFVSNINPDSDSLGQLAYQSFLENDFVDVAYFEPFYLKEFRATKPKSKL